MRVPTSLVALVCLVSCGVAWGVCDPPPLPPNAAFEGIDGVAGPGAIVGTVPDQWRAFAVGGGATVEVTLLPEDELSPGSPAVNAVRYQVDARAGDAGFDGDPSKMDFPMDPAFEYTPEFWIKTGNPDGSDQEFGFSFPLFDGGGAFLGLETAVNGTATGTWQKFTSQTVNEPSASFAHISFRAFDDGGTADAIMIAAPLILTAPVGGPGLEEGVPNPTYEGTAGTAVGDVTGDVPDQWRAVATTEAEAVFPAALVNPDFEDDPDGTTTGGEGFIDVSTITGWRHFAVGGASSSATVTSAAASSGVVGIELVRNNAAGGDSGLDKDQPPLREPLDPTRRILKVLVDARDGGPLGGATDFVISFQFPPTYEGNRGINVDPGADFETFGLTARTPTDSLLSTRFHLGLGQSVHLDNVQLTDVTEGEDRMMNGGFEHSATRLINWTGSATLSNDANSGNNGALIDGSLEVDPTIATLGGEDLVISFAAKKVSGTDTRIQVIVTGGGDDLLNFLADPGSGAYETFEPSLTVPGGVNDVGVMFRVTDAGGNPAAGSYLIDDVSVVSPPEPFSPPAAEISTVAVAEGAVFAGSPATNGVVWEQTVFGAGAGVAQFDHQLTQFSVLPGVDQRARIYAKTANDDGTDQAFSLEISLSDDQGRPVGDPVVLAGVAKIGWQEFEGPAAQALNAASGHVGVRLTDDGGDNAVMVALPAVTSDTLPGNLVPNPELAGSGGDLLAEATGGPVPDLWRAFAVAGADGDFSVTALAADDVFAGSPATNAVTLRRTLFEGDSGFDHDSNRFPTIPGVPYRASVYVKTANSDGGPQTFNMGFPLFSGGAYVGREPGGFADALADGDWKLFQGPVFSDTGVDSGHLSFRVVDDGGLENAIMIALPSVETACPEIHTITPNASPNLGPVEGFVEVTGANFGASTRIFLTRVGGPDIEATNVEVIDVNKLTFELDITDMPSGAYDVLACPSPGCPAAPLVGGFQISGCADPFADADKDGDAGDQRDFAFFQRCITGFGDPAWSFDRIACSCFDTDDDLDVDNDDLAKFILCASGPDVPGDPSCDD